MEKANILSAVYTILLILLLSHQTCSARKNHHCAPSSCGIIPNISFPFRLNGDPLNCGLSKYTLSCESKLTVLYLYSGKYYVQAINYNDYTIRVVDAGLQNNNFSSIPRYSLTYQNFTFQGRHMFRKLEYFPKIPNSISVAFINCENRVNSSLYVDTPPSISRTMDSYVMVGDTVASEVEKLCRVELVVRMMLSHGKEKKNMSYIDIHNDLLYGFELSWFPVYCGGCGKYGRCYLDDTDNINCYHYQMVWPMIVGSLLSYLSILIGIYLVKLVFGGPCVAAFLIYKWRRRHISKHDNVEEFLQSHNNLMPIRYSYANIKKMTSGFKDKLGEGGYGSVYKGKLRSGCLVAIKLLGKSKSNGQDFINEVASIGRIHHTNVVQLVGFCAEGSKRALVYDFMPNGSLDKHIFQ